jgi:hypothetical protein
LDRPCGSCKRIDATHPWNCVIQRFGQFLKSRSGTTLSKYELGNKKLDADDDGVIPFSRNILLNLANKLWFLERSFDATY